MKKIFLWLLSLPIYGLVVYGIYLILPPAFTAEVVLEPAKYMHTEESPITRSRVTNVTLLQPYDQMKSDLENFYRECKVLRESTARVMAKNGRDEKIHFIIQDVSDEISQEQILCAIEMLHKKQDTIWHFLNSDRRVIPPAILERERFVLIEIKDLSLRSKPRAVIRAAVLAMIIFVLAYSFWKAFPRLRKWGGAS